MGEAEPNGPASLTSALRVTGLDNPCADGDFGGAVQKLGAACSSAIGRLRYALDGDVVVPGEGRYLRAGFHHTAAGAKMIVSARAWY